MKWLLVFLFATTLCAENKLTVEVGTTTGFQENHSPQFEVLFSNSLSYRDLLLNSTYTDDGLSLKQLVQGNSNLSSEDLGELIFTANNISNVYSRYTSSNTFVNSLGKEDVTSAVGTVFKALFGTADISVEHVRAVVADFGEDASLESKIVFLQLFSHISKKTYDSGKLNQPWNWKGNEEFSTTTGEMFQAMRDWLEGKDPSEGVCYDTVLMLNTFAPLLGLQGAMVLGMNSIGSIHPEGIYFDTSNPDQTIVILQDWERLATIVVNSPKDLANALAEVVGSHLLASILYDAEGKPLKMVHSDTDLIKLKYMGHQELLDTIRGLLDNGLIEDEFLVKNSQVMAAIDYGSLRFEVRQFKSLIADNNLMFVFHYRPDPKTGKFITRKNETELALLKEGDGKLSDYYDQESNEHFSIILRHAQKFSTKKMQLIKDMLSLSLYSSLEMIMAYYSHGEDEKYNPSVSIPIFETTYGMTFQLFDATKNGVELTLSPFASFDLFVPKEAKEFLGSISNMINLSLKEAQVLAQTKVAFKNEMFLVVDASYAYSRIDHQLHLGIGINNEEDFSVRFFYERGFTNKNFPVFYLQDSSRLGFETSFDFKAPSDKKRNVDLGFDMSFDVEPRLNRTKINVGGRISY